jgi:hypothetical protein
MSGKETKQRSSFIFCKTSLMFPYPRRLKPCQGSTASYKKDKALALAASVAAVTVAMV